MKYLYTLIISQYHYSYHQIVIRNLSETPESFLDKARLMVVEIGSYKAGKEFTDYLGDLDPEYANSKEIKQQYNYNGYGDIYIINCENLVVLLKYWDEYREKARKASTGYKRKGYVQAIEERHDFQKIREIINKYFKVI